VAFSYPVRRQTGARELLCGRGKLETCPSMEPVGTAFAATAHGALFHARTRKPKEALSLSESAFFILSPKDVSPKRSLGTAPHAPKGRRMSAQGVGLGWADQPHLHQLLSHGGA